MNGNASALDALDVRLPVAGWAVLDAVRARTFTGEITLIGAPAVRLWADRGRIYFAERIGAPPVSARLVADGVLSSLELARGVVHIGGRDHVGALFERVPTADRHAITLAVSAYTQDALRTIAAQMLAGADLVPYAFDPHGVHAWAAPAPPAPPVGPPSPPAAPPPTVLAAPPADAFPAPAPAPAAAVPPPAPAPPAPPAVPVQTTVVPAPPAQPVAAPAPTGEAQPAAARASAAAPTVGWDRVPYLDRLGGDRDVRNPDAFSVIWPDGDVERRSGANGSNGHSPDSAPDVTSVLAGVPVGTRTRLLDDRFGAL